MARKSSRSGSDQPQSNTVLIVFLVFSILLNLGLGVMFYLAQDKIDQANTKEAAAVATQKKMEDQRNAATNVFLPILRAVVGDTTLTTDEINAMKENIAKAQADLPANSHAWYDGKVWKELMGRGNNDNGLIGPFSATSGKPAITLIDKVKQLTQQLATSNDKLKTAEANLAKLTKDTEGYKKEWNDLVFTQRLKAAQDSMELDKQNKLKQKDEIIASAMTATTSTTNEVEKQVTEIKTNFENKLKENKIGHDTSVAKEAEKYRDKINKLDQNRITSLNVPKARIVDYNPGTNLAIIDLGSAVNLPVGLTFSIHEHDANGNASPMKKAEAVVVKVLGDQLAQVRVTRMARPGSERKAPPRSDMTPEEETAYWNAFFTSEPRDFARSTMPLYKGDFLFNVVWDPAKQTRVALVGEFDLDGDGTDDLPSLINLLRAQGAEIDLYLDKANSYKPKGKIDYNTDVVVLGDVPTITARGVKQQTAVNKATEMLREGQEVQKEALEKGIRIVQLPKFLSELGISVPQVIGNKANLLNADVPPAANTPPAAAAPDGEKK
jgi:hypothetical protein